MLKRDVARRMGMALLLMLAAFTAGCGAGSEAAPANGASPGHAATAGATAGPPSAEPSAGGAEAVRTVEHAMGSTEIKGTPQRIVTLYQGATDVMIAFGMKPAGAVEASGELPVYEYLKADLAGVPALGLETQPNLEEIHKLKPDVIIGSKFRNEAIYDQLSAIAPTVMVDQVYEWKETVDLIGKVTGKPEKAAELLAKWDERVADFKSKMGDRLPIEASIVNFRADHARIYYMGYAGKTLEELGFDRPPGHTEDIWGIKLSSKESIPDMNADVMFVFNSGTDPGAIAAEAETWTNHPLWKGLDAYKNNQIYQVNEVYWNLAGGYLSAQLMLDELYSIFKLDE